MFDNYFNWLHKTAKDLSNSLNKTIDGTANYGNPNNTASDNAMLDLMDMFGIGTTRRANEYQTYMSNTAYQRSFADMQAAGINPAMVFQNGTGSAASSPTAVISRSSAGSKAVGVASLINSAANLAKSFNFDRNVSNNVGPSQIVSTVLRLSKLLM